MQYGVPVSLKKDSDETTKFSKDMRHYQLRFILKMAKTSNFSKKKVFYSLFTKASSL